MRFTAFIIKSINILNLFPEFNTFDVAYFCLLLYTTEVELLWCSYISKYSVSDKMDLNKNIIYIEQ
jgi:hypothetical protein